MKLQTPQYAELLVFVYCSLIGAGVVSTWGDHPHMQLASVAFLIFLVPVAVYWLTPSKTIKKTNPIFQYFAIVVSTIGYLGSLNAMKYFGIALSLAGFVPWTLQTWIWMISSLTWMPAMAYAFKGFASNDVLFIRMVFAITASFALSVKLYKMLKESTNEQKKT